jgi:hypothetical protein
MSYAEVPPGTETQQLLTKQEEVIEKIGALTDAVNGLGQNVQWIIDGVTPLMQMMGSPQLMSMLPGMMAGAAGTLGDSE